MQAERDTLSQAQPPAGELLANLYTLKHGGKVPERSTLQKEAILSPVGGHMEPPRLRLEPPESF